MSVGLRAHRVLETALYVEDVETVIAFYRDKLGFPVIAGNGGRITALDAGGATVLLVFQRGGSAGGVDFPGGRIPPCDGQGPTHLAFAIGADEFEPWEKLLEERGVPIESRVNWERGGRSLYVRDPAGNSVELATPGVWSTY